MHTLNTARPSLPRVPAPQRSCQRKPRSPISRSPQATAMATISLVPEHGYVAGVVAASYFLHHRYMN